MQDLIGNKWATIASRLPGKISALYRQKRQLCQKSLLFKIKKKPKESQQKNR
jgi:hypothetical protein